TPPPPIPTLFPYTTLFRSSQNQPFRGNDRTRSRIFRARLFNGGTKRFEITMPCHLQGAAKHNRADIIWSDGKRAIKHGDSLRITPQVFIGNSDLLEDGKVAGVEFECEREVMGRLH